MTTNQRGGQRDRDELAKTTDPTISAQRDLLLRGAEYPPIEIAHSFALEGVPAIGVEQPVEVTAGASVEEIQASGAEIRRFVTIKCRSVGHNGEFELAVHLGEAGNFPTEIDPADERFVGVVGFFDHMDDSHTDTSQCTDGPLGQYVLETSRALAALAKAQPGTKPTLQFQLVTPPFREKSTQILQLSELSIVELVG